MRNKLEIDNLAEILNLGYPHVCLSYEDYKLLNIVPKLKQKRYPCIQSYKIRGFYNIKTAVCNQWGVILPGYIKISLKKPNNQTGEEWSEPMCFAEEGGAP